MPFCFDVEECCTYTNRQVIRPAIRNMGLYSLLCECKPCVSVWQWFAKLWATFMTFRWLCEWCPPFILRLKKEADEEEEEANLEEGKEKTVETGEVDE